MILLENFRIFQKCPRHLVMPWRERRRHAQHDFEAARAMPKHKKDGFQVFLLKFGVRVSIDFNR